MSFKDFTDRSEWVLETNRLCSECGWTLLVIPEVLDYGVSMAKFSEMVDDRVLWKLGIHHWIKQNVQGQHRNWDLEFVFELERDATAFALRFL